MCLGVPKPKPYEQAKGRKGVTTEFRTLSDLSLGLRYPISSETLSPREVRYEQPAVESNPYHLAAVEAGRQPSYGKRNALIPDGLNCPYRHIEIARGLKHPFQEEQVIKDDHRSAAQSLRSKRFSISEWRLKQLSRIESLVESSKLQQGQENKLASWTAKKLGTKAKTAAMRVLQERWHRGQVCQLLSILRFFRSSSSSLRRGGSMELCQEDTKGRHKRKTQKEVAAGTMGPPHDQAFYHKKYKGVFITLSQVSAWSKALTSLGSLNTGGSTTILRRQIIW